MSACIIEQNDRLELFACELRLDGSLELPDESSEDHDGDHSDDEEECPETGKAANLCEVVPDIGTPWSTDTVFSIFQPDLRSIPWIPKQQY